tara:strand:- start:56 stop:1012 length:957 start_codon:yes stop_codon:yes gene_type:complete
MQPQEYFLQLVNAGTSKQEAIEITKLYFPHWTPNNSETATNSNPQSYFEQLVNAGTPHQEAIDITKIYYPHWTPRPPPVQSPYQGVAAPAQTYGGSQSQQPVEIRSQPLTYVTTRPKTYRKTGSQKTYYAPIITILLTAMMMFTPFLTFDHEDLSNSEEREVCEEFFAIIQSSTNSNDIVESNDIECPMNGYSSTIYSLETISNFDPEDIEGEGEDSADSSENDDEYAWFGIAFLFLLFSPIAYIIFVILSLISVGLLNKYPTLIGFLQLIYLGFFLIASMLGTIDITDDVQFSAHSNFAGMGVFFVGFLGIGYLIPK